MISIIVPVYKVEAFLDKCIASILAQTFTDLEIILVDDGSPDRCGAICDEYAKKDARIQVIHKKNGGLSDARNAGLDMATGEYIGFVDGDDFIKEDMYESLYRNLVQYQADIAVCGTCRCLYENGTYKFPLNTLKNGKRAHIFTPEEFIEGYLLKKQSCSVCDKLYKASVFNHIRFPVGYLSEDQFVLTPTVMRANRIISISEMKYFYVRRKDSITNKKKFTRLSYDPIIASCRMLKLIEVHYPRLVNIGMCYFLEMHRHFLSELGRCDGMPEKKYKDVVATIRDLMKKNLPFVRKNTYYSAPLLAAYFLICLNPYWYIFLYRKYWKIKVKSS